MLSEIGIVIANEIQACFPIAWVILLSIKKQLAVEDAANDVECTCCVRWSHWLNAKAADNGNGNRRRVSDRIV